MRGAKELELTIRVLTGCYIASFQTCKRGEFEESGCAATKDAVCGKVAACGKGQYQVREATATSDTVCAKITACTAGEYVSRGGKTGQIQI